jgi:hypothetical protein
MAIKTPNPRHGDYAASHEWPHFVRISEAPSSIATETGLAG